MRDEDVFPSVIILLRAEGSRQKKNSQDHGRGRRKESALSIPRPISRASVLHQPLPAFFAPASTSTAAFKFLPEPFSPFSNTADHGDARFAAPQREGVELQRALKGLIANLQCVGVSDIIVAGSPPQPVLELGSDLKVVLRREETSCERQLLVDSLFAAERPSAVVITVSTSHPFASLPALFLLIELERQRLSSSQNRPSPRATAQQAWPRVLERDSRRVGQSCCQSRCPVKASSTAPYRENQAEFSPAGWRLQEPGFCEKAGGAFRFVHRHDDKPSCSCFHQKATRTRQLLALAAVSSTQAVLPILLYPDGISRLVQEQKSQRQERRGLEAVIEGWREDVASITLENSHRLSLPGISAQA